MNLTKIHELLIKRDTKVITKLKEIKRNDFS